MATNAQELLVMIRTAAQELIDQAMTVVQAAITDLSDKFNRLENDRVSAVARITKLEADACSNADQLNKLKMQLDQQSGSGRSDKLNYTACNGLKPKDMWAGDTDKKGFMEFGYEITNCLYTLHKDTQPLMEEAVEHNDNRPIDICSLTWYDKDVTPLIEHQVWAVLYSCTTSDARGLVTAAGRGKGLQAWHDLHRRYMPTSDQDRVASAELISAPKPASSEADLHNKLTAWLKQLADHGARFKPLEEDMKYVGLKRLLPPNMYETRFAGETFTNLTIS